MKISLETLTAEAESTGFRPDLLEKVVLLPDLLQALQSHPFLKGKLVLKGGTALNLFVFDTPRLSVDIDLNYVGAESREGMLEERPGIEQAVRAVAGREGFTVRRMPEEHAGGKWLLRYPSALGQNGNLEIDINFMFRVPLWSTESRDSYTVGRWQAERIPVLDIHELAAGKLAALLSRKQARDLFDCHQVFQKETLVPDKLRTAFVVYGAMNRRDWRTVSVEDVDFDPMELASQLIPTLRVDKDQGRVAPAEFGRQLSREVRRH